MQLSTMKIKYTLLASVLLVKLPRANGGMHAYLGLPTHENF